MSSLIVHKENIKEQIGIQCFEKQVGKLLDIIFKLVNKQLPLKNT